MSILAGGRRCAVRLTNARIAQSRVLSASAVNNLLGRHNRQMAGFSKNDLLSSFIIDRH